MEHGRGIGLVAADAGARAKLRSWFADAGYEVAVASNFDEGTNLLSLVPDLLVTDLKLGEFNGLHLATAAKDLGVTAIVVGAAGLGLEQDAAALGVIYFSSVEKNSLLAFMERMLAATVPAVVKATR
jgi:DNA-binding NtrC family response regulator